jgi:hypothetical protein
MSGMAWLLLEAGVALALLIFIVWWTMPRPKKPRRGDSEGRND